MKTHNSIMYT